MTHPPLGPLLQANSPQSYLSKFLPESIFGKLVPDLGEVSDNWQLLYAVVFAAEGVAMLTVVGFALVIVWRLFGPKPVDEQAAQLAELWEDHEKRFPRKTKDSASLKGVLRSSYLPEFQKEKEEIEKANEEREEKRANIKPEGSLEAQGTSASSSASGPARRQVLYVPTTPRPTRVTVVRGDSVGACTGAEWEMITCHEAGHNHKTCFGALNRYMLEEGAFSACTIYHVDTPGHEEEGVSIGDYTFSLERQAAQLQWVVTHLGLKAPVGLGVGAGANVLLRFACDHPEMLGGLFLVSPFAGEASLGERNQWRSARWQLSWGMGSEALTNVFFPAGAIGASSATRYQRSLCQLHHGNLLKFIDALLERDAVDQERLQALRGMDIKLVYGSGGEGWISSLTGRCAGGEDDTLHLSAMLGQENASWAELDGSGGMVTATQPQQVVKLLTRFVEKL
ncbi:unnamed protein product [Chrysoparadoxa australica]